MSEGDAPGAGVGRGPGWAWDAAVVGAWAMLTTSLFLGSVRLNTDMGLLLSIGGRLAAGGEPYVDYLETNPPWIHLLMTVPMGLSSALDTPPHHTYHLLVALLLAVCLWACRAVLLRAGAPKSLAGLCNLALVGHGAITANAWLWGQKEHLVFLLSFPWFLVLAELDGRASPRSSAPGRDNLLWACLGVAAAIGCQIKPHYVIVGLIYAGALVAARRRLSLLWSPAFLGYAVGGLGYPLLFLSMSPASRAAFFDVYLPMVAPGYAAYNNPMWLILAFSLQPFLAYALAATAAWAVRERPAMVQPLVGYLVLGIVAFLVQQKGFPYHRIPLLGVSAWLAAVAVHGAARGYPKLLPAAAIFGLLLPVGLFVKGVWEPPARDLLFEEIERHIQPGEPLLAIDTTVPGVFPGAVERGHRVVNHILPSFGILYAYADQVPPEAGPRYHTLAEAPEVERLLFEQLARDLTEQGVEVVVVRTTHACWTCEGDFDTLALLEHNGFLTGPMAGFEQVAVVDEHTVFVRRD